MVDERLHALHERIDKLLGVGRELLAFGQHLVSAGRGIDLETMFRCFTEKKIFGLAEKRLLDAAILEDVERGVPEEAVAHGGGKMLQELRVTRMLQMDEILAL